MNDIVKPSTLPGFQELLPEEQILFNKLKDIIRKNYEFHGFYPLDTPVIEKSEVLLAKGGGETEAQIYRFEKGSTDMALRFDLTVPLARYVAQHISELSFPFRRYQIGKVYRGERAQKGRFREFYQCDIDIIGNGELSIINDGEIPVIIYDIFKEMGFDNFKIHVNNRKILSGFYNSLGIEDITTVLRTVDKLDKIGKDAVFEILKEEGLTDTQVEKIGEFLSIEGTRQEIIDALNNLKVEDDLFREGVMELDLLTRYMEDFGITEKNYGIDIKIARGLDYYTGTVYETFLNDYPELGSVCSGGRYDNLAANYTKSKLPGVGISIGLSRLFYQLREKNIIETEKKSMVDVLIIPMEGYVEESISLVRDLREVGVAAGIYTEGGKMGKKFKYADDLNIPYVAVIGENEVEKLLYTLKNMKTGEQNLYEFNALVEEIKRSV